MSMATYGDAPPMPIRIVQDDTKENKRPDEVRTAHRTIVLTAILPFDRVGGYDPARIEVYMNTLDNPIVISGDVSQASDQNNLAATINTPNGRLITPTTGEVRIPGQDEMWISAGTYPSRVAITIVRRI